MMGSHNKSYYCCEAVGKTHTKLLHCALYSRVTWQTQAYPHPEMTVDK